VPYNLFDSKLALELVHQPSRRVKLRVRRLQAADEATLERYANACIVGKRRVIADSLKVVGLLDFTVWADEVMVTNARPAAPVNVKGRDAVRAAVWRSCGMVNNQRVNLRKRARVISLCRAFWQLVNYVVNASSCAGITEP